MGRLSPLKDHNVRLDCRVERTVTPANIRARLKPYGGTEIFPHRLRTSNVIAAVELVMHCTKVRKEKLYLLMRNFSRMFREPEKTPCAMATEIPSKRPLQICILSTGQPWSSKGDFVGCGGNPLMSYSLPVTLCIDCTQ